jgi:hypothetical protein
MGSSAQPRADAMRTLLLAALLVPSPSPSPSLQPTQCVGDYCLPVPAHPTERCIEDPFSGDLGAIACAPISSPSPSPTR